MADKAGLEAAILAAMAAASGGDKDAYAAALADAIDAYAKTLKATGTAGSDPLPIA